MENATYGQKQPLSATSFIVMGCIGVLVLGILCGSVRHITHRKIISNTGRYELV